MGFPCVNTPVLLYHTSADVRSLQCQVTSLPWDTGAFASTVLVSLPYVNTPVLLNYTSAAV